MSQEQETRSILLKTYVNSEERDSIKRTAKSDHRTISDFLRVTALRESEKSEVTFSDSQ